MPETLRAAETLVRDGWVMVYCSDDPVQARMLEAIGCVAIMPLASLIGSGMGIPNPWNLRIIIDESRVPVIVDGRRHRVGRRHRDGIGLRRRADEHTAIAAAGDPVRMALAMRQGQRRPPRLSCRPHASARIPGQPLAAGGRRDRPAPGRRVA